MKLLFVLAFACSNAYADQAGADLYAKQKVCTQHMYWVQMAVGEHQHGRSFNWMYDNAASHVDKAWLDAMLKKVYRDNSARMMLADPIAVGQQYFIACAPAAKGSQLEGLKEDQKRQQYDQDHPRWEK